MIHRIRTFFAIVLAFVLALTTLGASAAPGAAASVVISADQEAFTAGESVLVNVTISNPTGHTIKVLKWFTPLEDVEEPLFAVTVDGAPVEYIGAIYKRPAPKKDDYVSLKAGESFTRVVDLGVYYDLSASGSYSVRYDVASPDLSSEKGGSWKNAEQLASNELTLSVEGRASAAPEEPSIEAVSGTTSFNKCTTTQQSQLITARGNASSYAADALSYLNSGKTGPRYTTWFGAVTTLRYNTVEDHFASISNAMDNAAVKFDCGCKKQYYAYVYPTKPYTIYLCKVFWTAPATGTDSKAGTLVHEMSHFNVVAGTDDYVYGQAGAKNLAITNPDNAVNNADNHEYFAENTPAQQ